MFKRWIVSVLLLTVFCSEKSDRTEKVAVQQQQSVAIVEKKVVEPVPVESVDSADAVAIQEEKGRLWQELKMLVVAGKNMEKHRGKVTPNCIDSLRINHKKIKILEAGLRKLPRTDHVVNEMIHAASILSYCTNCTNSALKWCSEADSILDSNKP